MLGTKEGTDKTAGKGGETLKERETWRLGKSYLKGKSSTVGAKKVNLPVSRKKILMKLSSRVESRAGRTEGSKNLGITTDRTYSN